MAALRNIHAPASAPGGFTWDHPRHVVVIPDDLANELLRIPDGGFVEVLAGQPDYPGNITEPAPTPGVTEYHRTRTRVRGSN